ncbi:copper-binding protein [Caenimonas sp. SL110]|uniref:copper-binding protein n=1 Tax=Caenimonas sp. SL110 TaxID=1450524 RepID=UPI0006540AE1|nr:copper-binding protein [Caenimonas sp. SL110]
MNAKHTLALSAILLSASVGAQQAPQAVDHAAHHLATAASAAPQSEGEVRKVDMELGKVTLRHGPLANLDMPAMTMVFTVAQPKLLEGLKQGDKVRFTADKKDGSYVVTAIEPAK